VIAQHQNKPKTEPFTTKQHPRGPRAARARAPPARRRGAARHCGGAADCRVRGAAGGGGGRDRGDSGGWQGWGGRQP